MTTTRGSTGNRRPGDIGAERAAGADVGELTYASAGEELDTIIQEFETGVVDVDRLVDQLERATQIVDELDRRLRRTRMRVEELVPRLEAVGRGEMPEEDVSAEVEGEIDEEVEGEIDDEVQSEDDGGNAGQSLAPDDQQPSPGLF